MKRIKLTESQLHKVIKESINKILKEEYGYRNLFGIEGLGMGKYSGDGIDAIIDEKTFNNSITININAQVELDVDLTIFKKYEKAKSEPSQGWEGLNENYWLMTNKSIIITAKK